MWPMPEGAPVADPDGTKARFEIAWDTCCDMGGCAAGGCCCRLCP